MDLIKADKSILVRHQWLFLPRPPLTVSLFWQIPVLSVSTDSLLDSVAQAALEDISAASQDMVAVLDLQDSNKLNKPVDQVERVQMVELKPNKENDFDGR